MSTWLSHTRSCRRWIRDFSWCFQSHLLQEKKFELSFVKRRNMIESMLKLWLQRKQLSEMLSKEINKRRRTVRLLSKEMNKRRRTVRLQSHCHRIFPHSSLHPSSLWRSSFEVDWKIVKISHRSLILLLQLSTNLHSLSSHLWWLEQLNLIVQWRKNCMKAEVSA